MSHTIYQIHVPDDSNLKYLPLMYFLPEDMIARRPTFRALPQCSRVVSRSEKMINLIDSDQFLNETMNAASALTFPHFGFGGWKNTIPGIALFGSYLIHWLLGLLIGG